MRIIENIRLEIDEEEVLRYQGCNNNLKKVNRTIMKITREEIERGYNLFEPKGISSTVKIKTISYPSGRVDLENKFFLNFNKSIINLLKGSSYLAIGVVTVGGSLENKVYELFSQGEYPRAVALDAVGTVSAKSLRNYMTSLACWEAREQNLQTTRCFSPGSRGWDISQQIKIFQMIPVDKIGVTLTDSYMMFPQKSLSWLTGVGKNITTQFKDASHSCKVCQAENCQFRKTFD